jgi:hypothetical protein
VNFNHCYDSHKLNVPKSLTNEESHFNVDTEIIPTLKELPSSLFCSQHILGVDERHNKVTQYFIEVLINAFYDEKYKKSNIK